ncbi:MAG: hypothetical protein FWF60_04135 [Oscillospiraceae bacterium]|nr:hypothetical protein [Oscillospiraceae bacterium]
MLGLGTWEFNVDTMFYRGKVLLMVKEKDGGYDLGIDVPGLDSTPPFAVLSMEVDGSTVSGVAQTDLLKGKDIPFSVTFEGDTAAGFLKVPFMGKINLKNGVRLA